jgi:hypothetical protein
VAVPKRNHDERKLHHFLPFLTLAPKRQIFRVIQQGKPCYPCLGTVVVLFADIFEKVIVQFQSLQL